MASTYYVAKTGSDANPGTSDAPFLTVLKGVTRTTSGDTVRVGAGVYNEAITLPTRAMVSILGDPGAIMDGGGTLNAAFYLNNASVSRYTVDGFEIRNYTSRGISIAGGTQYVLTAHAFTNNHIHHIIGVSNVNTYGIWTTGGNPTITGNVIHDIGWIGESTGIWAGNCHDHLIDNNQIWNCRKEGIRDYQGLKATITNNQITNIGFAGVATNQSLSPYVANNMISFCHNGINAKHVNAPAGSFGGSPYNYWTAEDPATAVWGRFWHNTIYRCRHADLLMDGGPETKIDIRNNIFAGRGSTARMGNGEAPLTVDYNVYDTGDPSGVVFQLPYVTGTAKTLEQVRADLEQELHGSQLDVGLNDPLHGDLDYPDTSPVVGAGVALPDQWAAQVGARGLPRAKMAFTPALKTVVDSKSKGYAPGYLNPTYTNDENTLSALTTGNPPGTGGAVDEWLIYDFGTSKTFNCIHYGVKDHAFTTNVKRFTVEVSDDLTNWTQVLDFGATGTDSNLSGFPVQFAEVTARYVRFTAKTNWGNANYMVIGEVMFGMLAPPPDPVTLESLAAVVEDLVGRVTALELA